MDIIDPTDGGQVSTAAAVVAPVATAAQIAPVAAPAVATPAIAWLDGADETTLGYVQNKGWSKPAEVLNSYQNLEKLLGADKAGNAVIVPKDGADQKEWNALYDRMGRPSGPDGYKVDLPEGGDKALQLKVFGKMHELGLNKSQGENLSKWFNDTTVSMMAEQQAARSAEFAAQDAQVRAEWGSAYSQNLVAAQAAARGLELDSAAIDKLSSALGHKGTMQLLQKIGTRMSEPEFVAGDKTEKFGNALTPGQAKSLIQDKLNDKDFIKKYQTGGAAEKAEMLRLHAFAYPE